MSRNNLRNFVRSTAIASTLALGAVTQTSQAVPVNAQFDDDPRCDLLPTTFLADELGHFAFFPLNEGIEVTVQPSPFTVCVPDDGLPNDWNVQIRNVSGIPWMDLHFVVDHGATLGNADGVIQDLNLAPGLFDDAMRIDGTVTLGVNNNLLNESFAPDEIFMPGETWRFNVSNFNVIAAANPQPTIVSPGVFGGSSPLGTTQGNASILANPIPEPGAIGAVVLGAAAALLMRRSRRRHQRA
jgi:hypothetical protein